MSAAFQSICSCSREPRLPPLKVFNGPNPQLAAEAEAPDTAVAVPVRSWRTIWSSGFGGVLVAAIFSATVGAAVPAVVFAVPGPVLVPVGFSAAVGAALPAVFSVLSGTVSLGEGFPATDDAGSFCFCCCCLEGDGRGGG